MEIKSINTKDGLPVTYYVFGEGRRVILVVNAPGMSIKFWVPIINLLKDSYRVIGVEYRGFPSLGRELSAGEYQYQNIVDDFEQVINEEGVEEYCMMGWCLGTKVMLSLYERMPGRVWSVIALNLAYKKHDTGNRSEFSKLVFQIKQRLKDNPASINRMIRIMDQVGVIPTVDFLSMIGEEEDDSPSLNLYDYLEGESSLSSLAFYLISTETGLINYLNIYEQFSQQGTEQILKSVDCPFIILDGEKDHIIRHKEEDLLLFGSNSNIQLVTVNEGSHFMLIEFPKRVGRMIRENLDRVASANKEHPVTTTGS